MHTFDIITYFSQLCFSPFLLNTVLCTLLLPPPPVLQYLPIRPHLVRGANSSDCLIGNVIGYGTGRPRFDRSWSIVHQGSVPEGCQLCFAPFICSLNVWNQWIPIYTFTSLHDLKETNCCYISTIERVNPTPFWTFPFGFPTPFF
jgi:hypothetical protein